MSNRITLSPRDRSLLVLLSRTPATTSQLLRASRAFEGGPFADDRRLRERLRALADGGFVRSWSAATANGGLQNYYKITPVAFATLYGPEAELPPRAFFAEIAPSHFAHTLRLAEAVVTIVTASHARQVEITRFYRENELTLQVGQDRLQPDGFMRLACDGRTFNIALEIDMSQESIDSPAASSIRRKIGLYHAYQEQAFADWHAARKRWEEPRFRVVFLTLTTQRAYHILAFTRQIASHRSRRLVYAATQSSFSTDSAALTNPLFLDHFGHWQSLIHDHPSARFQKEPVRINGPKQLIAT